MSKSNQDTKRKENFHSGSSFWALIVSNLVVIVWAFIERWPLGLMVWIYLSQNVILGFFWPAKVLASPVDSSYTKKVQSIAVFLPHYLTINFGYATYLYGFFGKELFANFKYILAMAGIFFLSETISYFSESSLSRTKPLSLAKVQLFPYARVVPMHFIIFIGIASEIASENTRLILMFFLLLKACTDVGMLWVERSRILSNLVTDAFARYEGQSRELSNLVTNTVAKLERPFLTGYSNSKQEQDLCRFCQRIIGKNETSWVIKEHVVCKECYKKIEKEKKKTS